MFATIKSTLLLWRRDTQSFEVAFVTFMWMFGKSSFFSPYIDINCRGSFIVNLTKTIVYDMPIVLPDSIEEQKEVASYLNDKCGIIDSLIKEKEELICDLESYKISYIYETVTGKRKVV